MTPRAATGASPGSGTIVGSANWSPRLGAIVEDQGTRFRVLAPRAARVELVLEGPTAVRLPMKADGNGCFEAFAEGVGAGARYRLALDDHAPFPDPASRYQPDGVHGPSEVVDPRAFAWSDADFRGVPLARTVLYELHVGTFTPEGTFAAAREKLAELAELGITAIELLPLADFPGNRNWGYDGAALFAPARCYGTPDDLRGLVDTAHAHGLAVHLDVVYNHFGPDGAYAAAFNPDFFSDRHQSPWGAGVNLDGPRSDLARGYFIENAQHWVHEYHIDGLRLDATHAMIDDSPVQFIDELAAAVHASAGERNVIVVAEDARNWNRIVQRHAEGGMGLDGVWSDDFHHVMRRHLAGDSDGYFADFTGTTEELARTIEQGWLYTGQPSAHEGAPRGTDPSGIPAERFIICTQNHDQVGNRAFGERLSHTIEPAPWRAATALLLMAPQTPMLFMGQEWAASAPFRFFTDHAEPLGSQVTEGRRAEFKRFKAWSDPAVRERIPDPQSPATFESSRLDWRERGEGRHAEALALVKRCLQLRANHPALAAGGRHTCVALDSGTVMLERNAAGTGPRIRLIVRLSGSGAVTAPAPGSEWKPLMTTEDPGFAADPQPPAIATANGQITIGFTRPGAVLLEGTRA